MRALLSVYDKTGIVEFGAQLHQMGVELLSTGGTYKALQSAGIPVKEVSEVAGFPEILDGRVKTLQPQIHAGILAIRSNQQHMAQIAEHKVGLIDLVVVNLYPFQATVANPNVTLQEAIEKIDIGGPSMVRGAAKNWQDVAIIVNPAKYATVLAELKASGEVTLETKWGLMVEAYQQTAAYDAAVSTWMATRGTELVKAERGVQVEGTEFPETLVIALTMQQALRYGENPHQAAAFYRDGSAGTTIVGAKQLHGKELSFNNINDAHAALELVKEFGGSPAAVAVKHANPCGVAVAETLAEAYQKAHDADPVSIFGGIIALNRTCDEATAKLIGRIFVEIVLAPSFTPEALAVLTKKKDIRLLEIGEIAPGSPRDLVLPGVPSATPAGWDMKRVGGGMLLQSWDAIAEEAAAWQNVTATQVTPELRDDLAFAMKVCKHVKSNAIVVVKNGQTLGVGAGQMNRIDATRHALKQAGEAAKGAVLASDAFFPFPDVVEAAGEAGIAAIVQPGGSIRDKESVAKADELGIGMLFTGVRHFKH